MPYWTYASGDIREPADPEAPVYFHAHRSRAWAVAHHALMRSVGGPRMIGACLSREWSEEDVRKQAAERWPNRTIIVKENHD
jgi:hypothetical protein